MVVAEDQVIPAQCGGVVMDRSEGPLGVENGLLKPCPEAHPHEGLYIARTLVRDRLEVSVRVLMLHVATRSSSSDLPWYTVSQSH